MTLRILKYGNHGIFLIMGNAGFISSSVGPLGVNIPFLGGALGLSALAVQGFRASGLRVFGVSGFRGLGFRGLGVRV